MLTGVETAGIVLAVLPLFISALEHYNDGLDPIKAFWNIDRLLPIQIRRLRNQHVHYEQTLRLLLIQVVGEDDLEQMIFAPNSAKWRTTSVQERLEERLQESYQAYQDTIDHMEEIMKKLAKDFKMDHGERANRTNLELLLKTNTRKDGAFEFKRRIKFAMSGKKMKDLLDELDDCNKELERFTDKSERLAVYRSETKLSTPTALDQVHAYAKTLYRVLCTGNPCQASHQARLKLEKRIKSEKGIRSIKKAKDDKPCFMVSVFAPQTSQSQHLDRTEWQDTQIQVVSEEIFDVGPSQSGANVRFNLPPELPPQTARFLIDGQMVKEVEDICTVIRKLHQAQPCLGFCLDGKGKLRGFYTVQEQTKSTKGTVNLRDLLKTPSSDASGVPKLSRKERMILAVILSSSYFQLQATPWLKRNMDRRKNLV